MQSITVRNVQLSLDQIKFESESKGFNIIKWNEILEILVETNDQGPFADDVFFVLVTRGFEIKIPQTDRDAKELFMRLQSFERFDNQAFIDAMSSSENKRFVCWKEKRNYISTVHLFLLKIFKKIKKCNVKCSLNVNRGLKKWFKMK